MPEPEAEKGAVRLQVGSTCNNRCVFCAQRAPGSRSATAEREQLCAELDRLRAAGGETVFIVGGEPTLLPELAHLVRYARSLGFESVAMQTNGRRLAYRAYCRELVTAGLDAVDVSIHGPRAEVHEYHTRAPGSFRQTLRGIAAARESGLRVGATTVLTRSNFRHCREQADLMLRHRVDALHLASARPVGAAAARFDRVVPRLAALAPRIRSTAEFATERGLPLLVEGLPPCLVTGFEGHLFNYRRGEAGAPGLVHGDACGECSYYRHCPGIDARYAERFGFREVVPARDIPDRFARQRQALRVAIALFAGIGLTDTG